MGHHIDNEQIKKYIGLSVKIGNAMEVKILDDRFDIGVDRRKDGWTTHKSVETSQ